MKKIMVTFGTRPEAIKMGPVIKAIQNDPNFQLVICVTGQHKEMLEQVLKIFKINPHYDLKIMKKNQTLFDVTTEILNGIKPILEMERPDIVLVHGDTSTTFAVALACFYLNVKVGHVEAGLRTFDMWSPFPEEFNRQCVTKVANLHFAPTLQAKNNLLDEKINEDKIFVTGNTAIDALKYTVHPEYSSELIEWIGDSKLILLTAHRRENLGTPMENIFKAVNQILLNHSNVKIIYPIHLNPRIRKLADDIIVKSDNVRIVEPLDVVTFHNLMAHSYLILTDSGGIQEEAPSLGKPVLVLRDTTERPEGIDAGTLKLIGTKTEDIIDSVNKLLSSQEEYNRMAKAVNPYGDGCAADRIIEILRHEK